jgi:hypothetical protein
MKCHHVGRQKSGQVLVITSLIITLLFLSSVLYIAETERTLPVSTTGASMAFPAYKLGAVHAIVSAIANISNGGNFDVLVEDLNRFRAAVVGHSYDAMVKMEFTPLNSAPYHDGVWVSWSENGLGVSSGYVSFAFNSSSLSTSYYSEYSVNVTSAIAISGYYTPLNGSLKQTEVTFKVSNEGKPALAQNFSVYYETDGSLSTEEWVQVVSPMVSDYGNGTYLLSFMAETVNPGDPLIVSVHCWDLRSIFVRANVTCVQN